MCGRFSLATDEFSVKVYLASKYNISQDQTKLDVPRYNIAPGQMVVSVVSDGVSFRQGYLKWGYIPSYVDKTQKRQRLINLRSETIWDKSFLAKSLASRRCVVLADGFFEWKRTPLGKTPYRIKSQISPIFSMAGLWNSFTDQNGNKEHTVAILTVSANEKLKAIHDRMPVILEDEDAKRWLDANHVAPAELQSLLKPYPESLTTFYEVDQCVNNFQNDIPACVAEKR